jgi:hypothetical protein
MTLFMARNLRERRTMLALFQASIDFLTLTDSAAATLSKVAAPRSSSSSRDDP